LRLKRFSIANAEVKMRSMTMHTAPWTLSLGVLAGILAVGAAAEEASVQVYECHQGGRVTFSGTPCAGQEQTVDLQYELPSPAQATRAEQNAIQQGEQAWNLAQANLLDNQILNAAQQISNLESQRDAQVAALRAQLNAGTQDPNPTAWQARLNQEIQSTIADYNDDILAQRQQLDQLKAQRAALGQAPAP
jgi:hypothetical protein